MNSLVMPVILMLTVVASVGFGVLTAYALVIGILHTFGHPAQESAPVARPQLVLVPRQTHASGD